MRITIGVRIAAVTAFVFLAADTGLALLGLIASRRAMLEAVDRLHDEELAEIAAEIDERPLGPREFAAHLASVAEAAPYEMFLRVMRPDGAEIASSSAEHSALVPRLWPARETTERQTTRIAGNRHRHRISARRFETKALGPVVVEFALLLDHEEETMRQLTEGALIAGPLVGLLAAGVGWVVARRALRPIGVLDEAARSIGAGPASARLPRPGTGDELDRLAGTLNGMLERLEASAARNLRFAGEMAHEVRTPLATVRARVESAIASAAGASAIAAPLETVLAEIDRLHALIQSLLLICRADEGRVAIVRKPVDVTEVAREAVEFFRPLAEAGGSTLALEANGAARVDGDRALLQRLAANLLDNAVRYSGPRGGILVRVARDGAVVRLEVADRGPGIDPAERERVFERFFRAERTRTLNPEGSGLGLALVRAVARAHGGEAAVTAREGGGSVFSVELAAADGLQEPGRSGLPA